MAADNLHIEQELTVYDNSYSIIIRIDEEKYDLDSTTQLIDTTLEKLVSGEKCTVHVQPADGCVSWITRNSDNEVLVVRLIKLACCLTCDNEFHAADLFQNLLHGVDDALTEANIECELIAL